jgi:hypothetical protein
MPIKRFFGHLYKAAAAVHSHHTMKTIQALYLGYFLILGGAAGWQHASPGVVGAPALLLLVVTAHFMLGCWAATQTTGTPWDAFTDRYTLKTWRGWLANATDLLLFAALGVGVKWIAAAAAGEDTAELAPWSLALACVGNLGCVILRSTEPTPTKATLLADD